MAKRAYASQFFADDKDIHDVLASERRGIPTKRLLQLARERGIFLSESEDREKLVHYVACLPFDWHLLSRLFDMTDREDRAEKKTSSTLTTKADLKAAAEVVQVIKQEREGVRGEAFSVRQTGNIVTIEVSYTEVDESRTRLNQRRSRRLTIRGEQTPDGIKFRHEANERAEEIISAIAEHLVDDKGVAAARRVIDLSAVRAPNARTQFFLDLIQGVPGHDLKDVSSVSVDRIPTGEEEDLSDDTEGGGDVGRGRKEVTPEDAEMMAVVRHVYLKGKSLLGSPEYLQLTKAGFFISRAVWTVEEKKKDGRRVEFEAEFEDGPGATGFRYNARGVYERNKSGEFNKTRRSISEVDKQPLMEALEDAAQRALTSAEAATAAPLLPPPAGSNAVTA